MTRKTTLHRWLLAGGGALILLALLLSLPSVPAVAQGSFTPTPRPLFALPDPITARVSQGGVIALAGNQRYAVTANTFSASVSVVDIAAKRVLAEVAVGESPRALVIAPDQTWLAVTARESGTLTLIDLATFEVLDSLYVGLWPWGVATDGATIYVALQGEDAVVEVDAASGEVLRRFAVPDEPTGLALWGDFLYTTHFSDAAITMLYLPTGEVIASVPGAPDAGLAQSMWLDPFDGVIYQPATRYNAQNPALTFDSTVFPVVNVLGLSNFGVDRLSRLALDVIDRPVNMPFAVAYDRARRWLWVVNAGSNDVSVIDLNSGFALAHIPVGENPRGIVTYADGSFAFVYNALDGTISVIETVFMEEVDEIAVTELDMPIDELIGAQLFHGSADERLSEDRRLSCATCHFDGGDDGRTWVGFPGGPHNTPSLYGLAETGPWGWFGGYDELADFNLLFTDVQHGDGLIDAGMHPPLDVPNGGRSPDLDSLVVYLSALDGPGRNALQLPPEDILTGEDVFLAQGCAECHTPPLYMDGLAHDLGYGAVNTPSLRWLWDSAPYTFDGRAPTLLDVFTADDGPHHLLGEIPYGDLELLITYLRSLPLED